MRPQRINISGRNPGISPCRWNPRWQWKISYGVIWTASFYSEIHFVLHQEICRAACWSHVAVILCLLRPCRFIAEGQEIKKEFAASRSRHLRQIPYFTPFTFELNERNTEVRNRTWCCLDHIYYAIRKEIRKREIFSWDLWEDCWIPWEVYEASGLCSLFFIRSVEYPQLADRIKNKKHKPEA